jgi:hypothetical protein
MMEDQPKKRNLAVETFIADVNAESSRVAIVGEISSKTDTVAVLKDRTGSINLLFQKQEVLGSSKVGNIYRVIGVVLPHDQGVEVKVEILQDFAGFDLEGYYDYLEKKKVK